MKPSDLSPRHRAEYEAQTAGSQTAAAKIVAQVKREERRKRKPVEPSPELMAAFDVLLPKPVYRFELHRVCPPMPRPRMGRGHVRSGNDATDAFKAAVREACAPSFPEPLRGKVQLCATFRFPDNHRRDMDNVLKTLMDALTRAGVWADDSQAKQFNLTMDDKGAPLCAFSIMEIR